MPALVSVAAAARILGTTQGDVLRALEAEGWITSRKATQQGMDMGITYMVDGQVVLDSGVRKPFRALRITGRGLDALSRALEQRAA